MLAPKLLLISGVMCRHSLVMLGICSITLSQGPVLADGTCEEIHHVEGTLSAHQICANGEVRTIYLSEETDSESSRRYTFGSSGTFQVFNNYPPRPGQPATLSNTTGARTYFLFPRTGRLELDTSGGRIRVRTLSRLSVEFDPASARISGAEGGTITEDPAVRRGNNGGVELTLSAGLMLDVGYQDAKAAHENPNRNSTFRDSRGRSCTLRNRDLFNYVYTEPNAAGRRSLLDVRLKFPTDVELATFLSNHPRCRVLDVSSLLPVPPASVGPATQPQEPAASGADSAERPESIEPSPQGGSDSPVDSPAAL